MTRHQLRLLLFAVSALALMAFSTFGIEWFRIAVESQAAGGMRFQVDLRAASACFPNGECTRVALARFQGWYSGLAAVTFYGTCAMAVIVAYQSGSRMFLGRSNEVLAKLGYFVAVVCFCAAGVTAYLFPPDAAPDGIGTMAIVSVSVVRTWAPALLLLAHAIAFVTLYYSVAEQPEARPRAAAPQRSAANNAPVLALLQEQAPLVDPGPRIATSHLEDVSARRGGSTNSRELVVARAKTRSTAPVSAARPSTPALAASMVSIGPAATVDVPLKLSTAAAPVETLDDVLVLIEDEEKIPAIESAIAELAIESMLPPTPRLPSIGPGAPAVAQKIPTASATLPPMELDGFLTVKSDPSFASLRGKLSFATTEVALSAQGIDAKREDGISTIVLWGDIVGVVARRLPPTKPFDGETFVDVVSTAGSTLRILPWTEVTGAEIVGINGDVVERARAFVQLVASRCPTAQVDNATRSFLGGRGLAAQLPTADLLAQHDARLS